jgi:hypothetical protein
MEINISHSHGPEAGPDMTFPYVVGPYLDCDSDLLRRLMQVTLVMVYFTCFEFELKAVSRSCLVMPQRVAELRFNSIGAVIGSQLVELPHQKWVSWHQIKVLQTWST